MIHTNEDTIAAIATAMSDAGIGIIRVSGKKAISCVSKYYINSKKVHDLEEHEAGTIKFGFFIDDDENIIDEVMVSVMKAPHSYTREDVVEVNTHGGSLVMQQVLKLLTSDENVCRLAEPGEFTKRAFLNGRIDLTRAEAVMDIIEAKNEFALKNSEKQLRGSMRDLIHSLREKILYEMAFIESALDDPENYNLDGYPEKLSGNLSRWISKTKKLLGTADEGRLRTSGIVTVIVGKPNSGKSSLLNVLTGEETAIVTDIAGTTRDVIEHDVKISDLLLHVIDTAGIREATDKIEAIGVDRAKKYASDADLILYVIDSTRELDEEDKQIAEIIKDKKVIVLLNKSDLEENIILTKENLTDNIFSAINIDGENTRVIQTSMLNESGINDLKQAIVELFFNGHLVPCEEMYVTNLRHKKLLENALSSLMLVEQSVEDGMSEDFYAIDLMNAYKYLGEILGEEVGEDLVNEIFSKFCMGK
ncbi:tRNA uridine-5-carboxymethylaminomethyl(34) synthesis GTPase MnmE [Butyrivibrio sp. NC3005]|uniref:tRNA uridine-5-carboxymethylaminomethyl(34) synthesis GTPase MnmE n=1 Tax=Butyrivibrio sp. NC3005 TaxID=1280685 RepID=UPI00040775E8|nr:tRNA uridine-5-carboxymethylaminomethyl(34) synthesis GTPase MnmE [Butyrivibrio sp. NC3005]